MSTLIACSKLRGYNEIGFAFGMDTPPMASAFADSSLCTSPEQASAGACSAFCYDICEDVWIIPVIVSVRKLRQVQRQVFFAHVVKRAHDATLQQAPKAVQIACMDVATDILTLFMVDRLMRKFTLQSGISHVLISGYQRHAFIHRLPNEAVQRLTIRVFDDLADHVALASDSADDTNFPSGDSGQASPLAPMAVLVLPTDVGFVNFDFAHQFSESSILHRSTNAMAHIPGSLVGPAPDQSLNLQGANPLLALKHQVDDLKPGLERIVRVLENGLADDGEAIPVSSATGLGFADPMKRASLQCVHFLIVAARAFHAIRPALILQVLLAGFFRREAIHGLGKCKFWFHGLTSVMLRSFYTKPEWVSSRL